ncbi:MAG: M20/M25/M40 family metallo-hydrolase [Caldisericota bacterium]|nr:M20/M25/M40 family metallo-hydrolase [Caldisericota bacterium]
MHRLIKELTSAYAASGNETCLHDILRSALDGLADEVSVTPLCNLVAVRRGQSHEHSILFAAHLDEVGAWVTRINDRGFLGFSSQSIDQRVWPGQRVMVHGKERLPGIIGLKPVHVMTHAEMDKPVASDDLWIDVGLAHDRVVELVPIGSTVTFTAGVTTLLNDRFAGKTQDDRLCAVVLVQALELLKRSTIPYDLVMAFTVQEEITGNGAWTSGHFAHPDVAIAVDVTHGDTDGVPEHKTIPLGGGPGITVGPVVNDHVLHLMRSAAKSIEVPTSDETCMSFSGTDADELQLSGCGIATGVIGIPLRYMHSPVEVADQVDVDRTARLVAEIATRFDAAFIGELYETVTH